MTTVNVYADNADLSVSLSAASLAVSYGTTSSAIAVRVQSHAGMAGTLTFSCSGVPNGMACSFAPAHMDLVSGQNVAAAVTITSAAKQSAAILGGWVSGMLLFPLSLLYLVTRAKRADALDYHCVS